MSEIGGGGGGGDRRSGVRSSKRLSTTGVGSKISFFMEKMAEAATPVSSSALRGGGGSSIGGSGGPSIELNIGERIETFERLASEFAASIGEDTDFRNQKLNARYLTQLRALQTEFETRMGELKGQLAGFVQEEREAHLRAEKEKETQLAQVAEALKATWDEEKATLARDHDNTLSQLNKLLHYKDEQLAALSSSEVFKFLLLLAVCSCC